MVIEAVTWRCGDGSSGRLHCQVASHKMGRGKLDAGDVTPVGCTEVLAEHYQVASHNEGGEGGIGDVTRGVGGTEVLVEHYQVASHHGDREGLYEAGHRVVR